MLYPPVNPTRDKKNNTIGADQVLGSLITTLDTVIIRAIYISKVEAILKAVEEELDPNY